MFKVVQKFLCFASPKHQTKSASSKNSDLVIEYKCNVCDVHFATKNLYKQHRKAHPSGNSFQEVTPEKIDKENIDPNNKTCKVYKIETQLSTPQQKLISLKTSHSVGSESTYATSESTKSTFFPPATSSKPLVEIYFRDSRIADGKLARVIIEESQIDLTVEKVKAKPFKQRREYELKFINSYRKGKSCVTYGISEDWIEKYEKYLNGNTKEPPGPIDNLPLKDRLKKKQIPKDTYAVNELLWRFLQKLYCGGPEITYKDRPDTFRFSDLDKLSDTHTTDTYTKSDPLDSMRNSILDIPKNIKLDVENSFRPIRMINPSFYCYMNSCLQALLGIPKFVDYISEEKYKIDAIQKNPKFWSAMADVVNAHSHKDIYFRPKAMQRLSVSQFDPSEQHDAHEFLNFLLTGFQEEINLPQPQKRIEHKNRHTAWAYYKKYNNCIIDELFAGQFTSKVMCTTCKNISSTYDPFLDLSLPIVSQKGATLNDCLAAFQEEEEIIEAYNCAKCKSPQKAKKKLQVEEFPEVLIVQLKRFQTHPEKEKIVDHVLFPIESWKLRTSKDSDIEAYNYTLRAVISHFGPIDSGHYVCFSKRGEDWFLCDDEDIVKVTHRDIFMGEAYVLIYEKRE